MRIRVEACGGTGQSIRTDRAITARAVLRIFPNLRSLGQRQCVLCVYAEITHRALEIDMAERHLHSPWIARSLVDQRHLRPPQAVCALGTPAQADVF